MIIIQAEKSRLNFGKVFSDTESDDIKISLRIRLISIEFCTTRGLNFWCGKVFEGGQVTFLIHFENVILVRLNSSHPHQKCPFEQL